MPASVIGIDKPQPAAGHSDVSGLVWLFCLFVYCLFSRLFVHLDFADELAVLVVVCVWKLVDLDLVFLDFLHNLRENEERAD